MYNKYIHSAISKAEPMAKAKKQEPASGINTGGGSQVNGNVTAQGDFIGRDLIILQQETHFAEIDQLLDTHPVQALRIYTALAGSLDETASDYFKSRVKNLGESLCMHMPDIILELGDRLTQAKLNAAIELCDMLATYWRFERDSAMVSAFNALSAIIKDTIPAEAIKAFILLWEKYKLDGRETLNWAADHLTHISGSESLLDALKEVDVLRKNLGALGKMPETRGPQSEPRALPMEPLLQRWTDQIPLTNYPFLDSRIENDLLMEKLIRPPKHWQEICASSRSSSVISDDDEDLQIINLFLKLLWQPSIFVTPLDVSTDYQPGTPSWRYLLAALAQSWVKYLGYNPNAPSHLDRQQQHRLAILLKWRYPDLKTLRLCLAQEGLTEWADQRPIIQQITQLLQGAEQVEVLVQQYLPQLITLRPQEFKQSIYIIHQFNNRSHATGELILSMLECINTVPGSVALKILGNSDLNLPGIPRYRLYWETAELTQHLNDRIQKASSGQLQNFNELFYAFPPMDDADQRIAKLADGSLARLLRLGHRLVEHHIQDNPNDPLLTPADLLWLESLPAHRDPLNMQEDA
ncbi:MAG TPA: hypothetical protein PKH92_09210 [Anaerolineaceae bacterium]|nr:hypothetical protein [Anaerolineaceae bacterium]